MSKLDLHGVRHIDVRDKVIRFVEKYWNSDTEVEIITGNSTRMKSLVIGVLSEYRVEYHVGDRLGLHTASIKITL